MKSNIKFYVKFKWLFVLIIASLAGITVLSATVSLLLFITSLILTLVCTSLIIWYLVSFSLYYKSVVSGLIETLTSSSKPLSEINTPVVVTNNDNVISWYNESFGRIYKDKNLFDKPITDIININFAKLNDGGFCDVAFCGREFTVYKTTTTADSNIYYLFDNTKLKYLAREYRATRPVSLVIDLDNFSEITKNLRESDKNGYKSHIFREIENWLADCNAIVVNLNNGILALLDERGLNKLHEERFSILKNIKKLDYENLSGITLSIGIGKGATTMHETQRLSLQALEMAQSRGGDQVVIKTYDNNYKFFGGNSKSTEKHSKVRARAIASSIYKMIEASSNVIVMGHKSSDFDCLGASFALASVALSLKKPTNIVINKNTTLALPLYNELIKYEDERIFIDGNNIDSIIDNKTLLIICDVHRPSFLDNEEVYNKCKNVVVIDHHRLSVDAISNAVIFYHETATSSTCEMVTELMQYMKGVSLNPNIANALLSGIILDTKNYCMHTGIRTFEAAAFLRSCNANTVTVHKLFSDSITTYLRKTAIVSTAEFFDDCAVSYDENNDNSTRVAASQAADELLNLNNINASFVMSKYGEQIYISARSFGAINVQLIMESLGGGGHQNMAACQLKCDSFEEAKTILLNAIIEYKNNH